MNVRRARYAKIRALADQVVTKHGVRAPAVPIERFLTEAGIEVRQGDLGDVSGLIARSADKVIVGLNRSQSIVRRRFTMAHEFGHYLLHEGLTTHTDTDFRVNYRDRASSEATYVEEIEANYFAASVLMPRRFLDERDASAALDDDEAVARLARTFEVSRHAMSLRLVNEYGKFRPY